MIQLANPGMLWALALVVVPVVLHLLRKPSEPPAVEFGATRLLERSAKQLQRRARIRQWLLLAVRVALLAAIALAFARPLLPAPGKGGALTGAMPGGVTVVANNRQFLDAALPELEPGPNKLVFLDDQPAVSEQEIGARLAGISTGKVSVAAGPYFHPALAIFDEAGRGDLRRVRVWRWWRLEPTDAVVVARLSNGDPFIVERRGVITCAVAAEPGWSDLVVHAHFVPLVRELAGYLQGAGPAFAVQRLAGREGRELTGFVVAGALLLAIAEMVLAGLGALKLIAAAILLTVWTHPTFQWTWPRPAAKQTVVVVDRTDSMRFRPVAGGLPRADVELTGKRTALGEALLALSNRAPAAVILASDGQHNSGVSPAWAAAQLGAPVFTVAVGEPAAPRDVSIVKLEATELVVLGEEAVVQATIRADGFEQQTLVASVDPFLRTNIAPGAVSLRFRPERAGIFALEIEPLPGEATTENNRREFAVEVVGRKIRVFIRRDAPGWEYRHVRQALRRDPLVEVVEDAAGADVTVSADGETWRLRAHGDEVFENYWRARVRGSLPPVAQPQVSEELYALWRADELLREVARVSGGRFFTAETVGELPAALEAVVKRQRRRFDLRDSWWVLVAVGGLFISSWVRRRPFS